jgi:hypothetical protein
MAVMPEVLKTLAGEVRPVAHEGLLLIVSARARVQQLVQLAEVALGDRLLPVLVVEVVERIPLAIQHLLAGVGEAEVGVLQL